MRLPGSGGDFCFKGREGSGQENAVSAEKVRRREEEVVV